MSVVTPSPGLAFPNLAVMYFSLWFHNFYVDWKHPRPFFSHSTFPMIQFLNKLLYSHEFESKFSLKIRGNNRITEIWFLLQLYKNNYLCFHICIYPVFSMFFELKTGAEEGDPAILFILPSMASRTISLILLFKHSP